MMCIAVFVVILLVSNSLHDTVAASINESVGRNQKVFLHRKTQTLEGGSKTVLRRQHSARRKASIVTRHKRGKTSKKKSTPAPTLSVLPSSTPSVSHAPSISLQPSSSPSSSPTVQPSSTPTTTPTGVPSLSQQPSFHPTTSPTSEPSSMPSVAPTISSLPSSNPSTSSSPTIDVIEGSFVDDTNNSIESGCVAPPGQEQNFAAKRVRRITVDFLYVVRYRTDDADSDQQAKIIHAMEKDFHSLIFDSYVKCDDFWPQLRSLREENMNKPIGASSLPIDKPAEELACTETKKGEKCLPINGGITIIYPVESDINTELAGYDVLEFMMNAAKDGTLVSSDPAVVGVDYHGKLGAKSIPADSSEDLVASSNVQDEFGNESIITPFTLLVAVASVIIVGSALYLIKMRTRGVIGLKKSYGALREGKGVYDFDKNTLDSIESSPRSNRLVEIESFRRNDISRSSAEVNFSFPFSLPVIEVGDDTGSLESDKVRYYTPSDQHAFISTNDVDFHYNHAHSEEELNADGGFSDDDSKWYEDSEIDFSAINPRFSIPNDALSIRTYEVSNTVEM